MSDSIVQVCIVAVTIHLAGTGIAFYLWTENRTERFLQFWTLAWAAALVKWLVHYPAEFSPPMRVVELVFMELITFFMALGSYYLIPGKPGKQKLMAAAMGLLVLADGISATLTGRPFEMAYALLTLVLVFVVGCMWAAYRETGLLGYVFAAATCLCEIVIVIVTLFELGEGVGNSIIVPLFNIPLILSIVVIAHQRDQRQLLESERTLQKIFETAPTPLIIVRPPAGEVERANPASFEMLGISPERFIGRSTLENGLVKDTMVRQAMYDDLAQGRRVQGRKIAMLRAGRELRTVSVNADRIVLAGGDRYIFSFYDLTDLRHAEKKLQESAEEMHELHMRLAHVEDGERRALHAELHDQVSANLSALRLELDVAARLLSTNNVSKAELHLGNARALGAETMARARDLMAGLRPPALDDFGLIAALRTLAESQSSRMHIPIDVTGNEVIPRPGPLVEISLFRIAQEAVMNAVRHASATRIAVAIAERNGGVILTVSDNGVGFDFDAAAAKPNHWGLKNMRERARAIGGELQVETVPGRGTRIRAEVPREAAS